MFNHQILIRTNLLCSCFLLLTFFVLAQKPCTNYLLKGKLTNAEGEWLYIKSYDYKTYHLLDSVRVKNGSVAIQLSFNEPTVLLLICKDKRARPLVNCGVNYFTWDLTQQTSFSMQDNGISGYYDKYHKSIEGFNDRMVELSKQSRVLENNQAAMDSLNKLRAEVQSKYPVVTRAFIRNHTSNFAALSLLRYYFNAYPVDTVRAMYAMLSKDLKQYPAAKTIQEYLDLEKKQLSLDRLIYSSGKDSVAGFNYYVVDFWGSWCGPCIASIPALKELYQQYRPKNIQFVGLAFEHKKDLVPYYKAQEKHQMPWPQSYVVANEEGEHPLMRQYYISQYPTYMILDSNYRIRYRMSSHEELKEKLKTL